MVPKGWRKGVFEEGIRLISGQHVEASLVNDIGEGAPYLTGPADFPNGKIIVSKHTAYGKKFSQKRDLLVTVKGSGTGKVIESDDEYAISRQLMAVRPLFFDPKFTYYNLVASVVRYERAAAGLIPGISRDDVLHTPILIPPISEQKKIAQILSTWDKAIATTEKLIANSQQQKKALMQQLLTGKKRFPRFEDEWRKEYLKDVANIVMGSSPKSESYNESKDGLPLIQGNADIKGRNSAPRIYTSQITKECNPDDILLSVRAPVGAIALSNHHACIGRGIAAISAKKGAVQKYLYQWMLAFEPKWARLSQGSTFESVNSDDIKSLHMIIPSFEEQQEITLVLSNADDEIDVLQKNLEILKQEKKALMQQLLTGKRRVKVGKEAA